ncbi:MAG: response regulator transcription factor [Acidobacteriota bacterium]|nr:response regulator transcription factor [Acidobacteriota bacterium]
MAKRALAIEDDPDLRRLITLHLEDLGCEVVAAATGRDGLEQLEAAPPDLVVLDLMLPDLDGLEICRRIRERDTWIGVLMLTARSSEADRVLGLELGADDYLTKPFSVLEFRARIKALFRRADALTAPARSDEAPAPIRAGELTIDPGRRQVRRGEERIELTAREFDLLWAFARHPGQVFTRAQLLDQVWGYGHEGYEHTVNSHINRLRGKIERDPRNPRFILTVWGVGYKFGEFKESPS